MTDDRRSIHVDEFLAHPVDRVWRALTDPEKVAGWLMPNDFQPVVGHRFTFETFPRPGVGFDGTVHCEVLEIVPEERIRISWQGGRLDTTVTFVLVPEGRGTRVFLSHEGFDPDDQVQQTSRDIMGGGWRSRVFAALDRVLSDA